MARLLNLQIIATAISKGEGTEASPCRRVEQWYSPDGTLLLQYDPHTDETTGAYSMVEFLRNEHPNKTA